MRLGRRLSSGIAADPDPTSDTPREDAAPTAPERDRTPARTSRPVPAPR